MDADPELSFVTTSAGSFRTRAWGPPEGRPALLLHGFPQTSLSWMDLAPILATHGYRVVAVDQRGYSPGARPASDEAYQCDELVRDVLEIAQVLDWPTFHLVGHDWGGWVAWHVAARHPQRVATLTALCTPHPSAVASAAASDPAQAAALRYLDELSRPGTAARLLADDAAWLRSAFATTPRPQEHVAAMLTPGTLDAALGWYRAGGWRDAAMQVCVPVTYLWPDQEHSFLRSSAEATAGYVTGSYSFQVMGGAGHWLAETHAPQVAAAIEKMWRQHL